MRGLVLQNCESRLGIGRDVPSKRNSTFLASVILAQTGLKLFKIMDQACATSIVTVVVCKVPLRNEGPSSL